MALFLVYQSFFPGSSWTLYPPLSVEGQLGFSRDIMIVGLHIVGVDSLLGTINFSITVRICVVF